MRGSLLAVCMLLLQFSLHAAGQEARDSVYVFRFVTGEDMFFVPWSGNGAELGRLERCVERHKAAILSGAGGGALQFARQRGGESGNGTHPLEPGEVGIDCAAGVA